MLNQVDVLGDVQRALEEDVGAGDVSAALLPPQLNVQAEIISREPMLVCGLAWVNRVFLQIDPHIELTWYVQDGEWLPQPSTLCLIKGRAANILTAERTALNFLQTLSGTATQTHYYVMQLKHTSAYLLDTRKTLPGLRKAQKYAVTCGGGKNHRQGLYDAFLIKENHIKACGSLSHAIQRARKQRSDLLVEVEVETLEELLEALAAKPDRILLDNFTVSMVKEAVALRNNVDKECLLEVSGGIELNNLTAFAKTGIDYISVGAITKSVKAIDLSLLIRDLS